MWPNVTKHIKHLIEIEMIDWQLIASPSNQETISFN